TGQPVVFSHGWPLNADAWDDQVFFVASHGHHAIAHDRRGHGRSSQPWDGNDMDHYADDLAALMEALDLHDAVLVGHSTGGGEAAYDCIKAFSETDQTEDLKRFDIPTLIIHGDDDQIVPIADSALLSSKLVKDATLKVYPGAPHGLMTTHKRQFNEDLLAFLR